MSLPLEDVVVAVPFAARNFRFHFTAEQALVRIGLERTRMPVVASARQSEPVDHARWERDVMRSQVEKPPWVILRWR
jgi:hypothetical protein